MVKVRMMYGVITAQTIIACYAGIISIGEVIGINALLVAILVTFDILIYRIQRRRKTQ